ncbi:MAG: copper chaperone PCu(A)C [Burkholderiaceae bacterium]|nr:copper chaperone PCu(A)C [Burkholderiaceae bacterium]
MKKIVFIGFLGLASVTTTVSAHEGHRHRHDKAGDQHNATAVADAPVSQDLTVSSCWIRSLPLPAPSAGYFVAKNSGANAVKLVGAASPSYGMVMLHQTTNHDGLSKMSMADAIDIPAGSELEFKPGGYHAMLEKPQADIPVGSTVMMDFMLDNGQKASAQCEVKSAKTMAH